MTRKEIYIFESFKGYGIRWSLMEAKFLKQLEKLIEAGEPLRGLSDKEKMRLYKMVYKYKLYWPGLYEVCKNDYRCRPAPTIRQKLKKMLPLKKKHQRPKV